MMREIKAEDLKPEHIGKLAMSSEVFADGKREYVGRIVGYKRQHYSSGMVATVCFGFVPDSGVTGQNLNAHVSFGSHVKGQLFLL